MANLKVGILGTGDVGQTLGRGLVQLGYEVKLGSRDPNSDKLKKWQAGAGARASTGTFAEAASFGDVLILATLWTGTKDAICLAGPEGFKGKVLLDTTNPLDFSSGMPPRLYIGHTDSAGEQVQRWLPETRVVKCFNTVGNLHMVRPSFPGGKPTMFICGNDQTAKKTANEICVSLGWPPVVDIGGIEGSRYLEMMAMVWISVFAQSGSGNHAFSLLKK